MQVRTYALDRAIEEFARAGGRQLVLLGAGLDARALRLRGAGLRVFEVDHPATQAMKRPLVGDAATLVPWDFESEPLRGLVARLSAAGYRAEERGCVIWEGVSMYLSEPAIEETFALLRDLLPAGSVLAFTYFGLGLIARPSARTRLLMRALARGGEPWRWGWEPAALPSWLAARGFTLRSDEGTAALGARWLPPELARRLREDSSHEARRIAVAERRATSSAGAP
jgi:methyltransferase (TIGR00027 family)